MVGADHGNEGSFSPHDEGVGGYQQGRDRASVAKIDLGVHARQQPTIRVRHLNLHQQGAAGWVERVGGAGHAAAEGPPRKTGNQQSRGLAGMNEGSVRLRHVDIGA